MPPQRRTAPAAVVPADPLADLRQPDGPQEPSGAPAGPGTPETPREAGSSDEDQREAAVLAMVHAWHADPTAQSFGHGGGTCGCRYLAALAVAALEDLVVATLAAGFQAEDGSG